MASRADKRSTGTLRAIALFKFFKGLLLVLGGLGALKLMDGGGPDQLVHVAERLHLDAYPSVFNRLLATVFHTDPKKFAELGVGAFGYGALFLVEGVGLWLQKRWAEYLTIVTTAGFVPFEVYELVKRVDAMRIVVLVINLAIVAYLVWRVRSEGRERRNEQRMRRTGFRPVAVRG